MLLADRDHLVMYGVILFDLGGASSPHEKLVSLGRVRNGKERVGMSPQPVGPSFVYGSLFFQLGR